MLAQVYVELTGGRQIGLELATSHGELVIETTRFRPRTGIFRAPRPHAASAEELARHKGFLDALKIAHWTR